MKNQFVLNKSALICLPLLFAKKPTPKPKPKPPKKGGEKNG